MMSRMRASDAHSYSGVSPTTFHPMDFASSNSSAWRREAKRTPPVRSTRPSSGSTVPSNKPKSDDLPSPLRPTTPTQSPSSTPRESDSKITFVGYSKCTFSQPNRKAIACCSFVRASPFFGKPSYEYICISASSAALRPALAHIFKSTA